MQISVYRLTSQEYAAKACSFTINKGLSHVDMFKLAKSEHSPLRTQMFWIEMYDIPTFVSVHLVRHKIGVEHYVKSNREDRGGDAEVNRFTPINHAMFINAQALINMSRKRLCNKASKETQDVWKEIVRQLPDWLKECCVPDCIYRGKCNEFKTCGEKIERIS